MAKLTLLDGQEYEVAPLPFNRKTISIIRRIEEAENRSEMMLAMVDAAELSLTVRYGKERAHELVEEVGIPMTQSAMAQLRSALGLDVDDAGAGDAAEQGE